MKTISQFFKFDPLRTKENAIKKYRELNKDFGWDVKKYTLPSNFSYVGLEVEVEKLPRNIETRFGDSVSLDTWSIKRDGSLRNSGMEFVSNPIRGSNLIFAILELENFLKKEAPNHEFSDRTSVHVHLNIRNLTEEELYKLILLYVITEPLFYRFVELYSVDRKTNVFCVPVQQFLLNFIGHFSPEPGDFSKQILSFSDRWQKYSGLNLLPIKNLGTIEFRQLGGTINPDVLIYWISLIQKLKIAATQITLPWLKETVLTLNTNSHYTFFIDTIFGFLQNKFRVDDYQKYLERGVSLNKAFFQETKKVILSPESFQKATSSYFSKVYAKYYGYPFGYFLEKPPLNEKTKKPERTLEETVEAVRNDVVARARGERPVRARAPIPEIDLLNGDT